MYEYINITRESIAQAETDDEDERDLQNIQHESLNEEVWASTLVHLDA